MYQEQNYALPPRYETVLCRDIGVLQHIQTLLSTDATLNDVARLVQGFQQEFGAQEQLEQVIQVLVSRSLKEYGSMKAQSQGAYSRWTVPHCSCFVMPFTAAFEQSKEPCSIRWTRC